MELCICLPYLDWDFLFCGFMLYKTSGGDLVFRVLFVLGSWFSFGYGDCSFSDCELLSAVTHTWSQPVIKGTPPTPRDSHSCTTVGENLFVFGGTDGTNPLKDLHILDTCE